MITFARHVGVAPGTTTLYMPYATVSELQGEWSTTPGGPRDFPALDRESLYGADLGLIYNDKWWKTGRSWPALGDAACTSCGGLTPWYKDPLSLLALGGAAVLGFVSYKMVTR